MSMRATFISIAAAMTQLFTTWRVAVIAAYFVLIAVLWRLFSVPQVFSNIKPSLKDPSFIIVPLLHVICILIAVAVFIALLQRLSRPENKTEYEAAFVEHDIITKNGMHPILLSYVQRKSDGIITMIFYTAGLTGVFLIRQNEIEEYLDITILGEIEYIGKSRHIIRIRATEGITKVDRGAIYED